MQNINYELYKCSAITNRSFPFSTIDTLISKSLAHLEWEELGLSFEERPIRMVRLGKGPIKLMLWSQMHGNEPTATAALFDLINYLQSEEAQYLLSALSIYIIPVVNPDGLEQFTRRNAQQIDINRDYLSLQSVEAKILKSVWEKVKPDFAFNLHDQSSLYCNTLNKPVAIALLAPAADTDLSGTWHRTQAMKLISVINHQLQNYVPQQVARFKDEYEPRAFGDNFQKSSHTILIESGYLPNDPEKQFIRKLNFLAIIAAFESIVKDTYQDVDLMNYLMIPLQSQDMFHLIIKNCKIEENGKKYDVDLGLNYQEELEEIGREIKKTYFIEDIGDLSTKISYEIIDANELLFSGTINISCEANLELRNHHADMIFEVKSGIRI